MAKSSPDGLAWIAQVVRSHRAGKFSLEQLASAAGVSAGLLSQIERGRGNPSLSTLEKVAAALDVPLGEFFQSEPREPGTSLVRAGSRPRLFLPQSGREYELLTPYPHDRVAVLRTVLMPAKSDSEPPQSPMRHPGDEVVIVVAGALTVAVDGTPYELGRGDSITYDSGLAHTWANVGRKPAEIWAVRTPPDL